MTIARSATCRHLVFAVFFAFFALLAPVARAQDPSSQKEAETHFQRAVQLYSEADYRAALVEFKRAYEIAPHVTVLYNLGQCYYQLQNYADALSTFEKFLAEGGTAHRAEVENAVNVLRTRVGKLDISTPSSGWDISIDDEAAGKTPFPRPVPVSIGRRKVVATKAGESSITRWVEVGAGETAAVALTRSNDPTPIKDTGEPKHTTTAESSGNGWIIAGWIGTGALVVGTVVTGVLASSAASDLDEQRKSLTTKASLDDGSSKVKSLALVTDILGASALVLGGVTLYFTLTKPSAKSSARLGVGGSRLLLEGSF